MSGEGRDEREEERREEKADLAERLLESEPDNAGDMGVSSNRVGPTGGGGEGAMGTRDTSVVETPSDGPTEQSAGGEEGDPEGLEPKAGYSSEDPRSD